jgi:hypothetical protein
MTVSSGSVSRTPCFIVAFFDLDSIRRTIECLQPSRQRLSLHVVENHSPTSESELAPYLRGLVETNRIDSWIHYAENISGNAMLDTLSRNHAAWKSAEYVVITDGDLEFDDGWLDESIAILADPKVFACGVSMSLANLPLAIYPNAVDWVPPPIKEHANYTEGLTGVHLLAMRTIELERFLSYRQRANLPFVDSQMHRYCYSKRRLRWARTRRTIAHHITWDIYADLNHPYTRLKNQLMQDGRCWEHRRTSRARVVTADGVVDWDANSDLYQPALKRWFRWW